MLSFTLIPGVWALKLYYNREPECWNWLDSNTPEIPNLILLHTIQAYTTFSVVFLRICIPLALLLFVHVREYFADPIQSQIPIQDKNNVPESVIEIEI